MKRTGASAAVCVAGAVTVISAAGGVVLAEVEELAPAIVNSDRFIGPLLAGHVMGGGKR